jgi:hypothetical protein
VAAVEVVGVVVAAVIWVAEAAAAVEVVAVAVEVVAGMEAAEAAM